MFVLARFFSCLTYSNLLRFPFFMKLAHRHLFAVLFSFQRTIALSDLISLSRHFSFVKQIFLFFVCFFRAVYRLIDGGYYPIILFLFCQPDFFRFYRHFRFCSHLPLPTAPPPPSPTSGDGFSVRVIPLFFCLAHSKTTCNTCTFCLNSSLRSRMTSKYLLPLKKRNSLLPSFLSGVKHT